MDEFQIDALINNAITELADDNAENGAENLEELAGLFASAGFPRSTFNDIRKHIIESAIQKTDPIFIKYKLENHERKLQEKRIGHANKIIH